MTAPHSILVVDDDPELLLLVQTVLKRIDATVTPASSVRAAQEFLNSAPVPDLMILDLMMPEISGEEFLRLLRDHPKYAHMPILIVSAKSDPATIRTVLALGADRYLTKPYMASNLLATVQEMLKARVGGR